MKVPHVYWILDAGPLLEQFPIESLIRNTANQKEPSTRVRTTVCTTPLVVGEVKSEPSRTLLEARIQNGVISVMIPDDSVVPQLENSLKKTGSWWILSPADQELLALALTLKRHGTPRIVTNDFELQNACVTLGISWQEFNRSGARKPKIRDRITWIFQCTTCKRKYNKLEDQCPSCGGTLKRKVKTARRMHA